MSSGGINKEDDPTNWTLTYAAVVVCFVAVLFLLWFFSRTFSS